MYTYLTSHFFKNLRDQGKTLFQDDYEIYIWVSFGILSIIQFPLILIKDLHKTWYLVYLISSVILILVISSIALFVVNINDWKGPALEY